MSLRWKVAILTGLVAATTVAPGRPAGASGQGHLWQRVSFEGVSLRVPASWPVIRFSRDRSACPRFDVHAVYLGTPGPDPGCPARLVGRSEAVLIGPLRRQAGPARAGAPRATRATARGALMLRNADWAVARDIVDTLPAAGVQVSISYRADRALALAIESSITVGPAGRAARTAHSARTARTARAAPAAPAARTGRGGRGSIYAGPGFDTCAAPGPTVMAKWLASPYRAIGIYIGGVNRACAQAYLTPAWLTAISAQGWRYFPIYPGLQSSCVLASGDATISGSASAQAAEGSAAADDAVAQAAALGIPHGTPLIFDMEAYGPACDKQVVTFLSAWDAELHADGYVAGVYESFTNIGALVAAAATMTEPDVIYYADWDGQATTTSSYMPATMWTGPHRLHQYLGGHVETYGGAAIDIDSDQLDVRLAGRPVGGHHGGFRIAVAVNSNGTAEWFARTTAGTLAHAWQQPPGSLTWSATHQVGNSPAGLVSNPSVTAEQDGRLTVFARDAAGRIAHAWQQAGFPNGWEWGSPLAVPPLPAGRARAGTDPGSVLLPGGQVEVFQTTASGAVVVSHQRQPGQNTVWTPWQDLGGNCASTPVPVVDVAQQVRVFCVTTAGTAAVDTFAGTWGPWNAMPGGPPDLTGPPAVTVSGAGLTEMFAATANGGLADAWQAPRATSRSSGWTWGAPLAGPGTGTRIVSSPAAASWPSGFPIVYAALAGGRVGYLRQLSSPGAPSWSAWATTGAAPGGAVIGSPAGWLNAGGAAGLAVLDGTRMLATTSDGGTGWAAWSEAGGSF